MEAACAVRLKPDRWGRVVTIKTRVCSSGYQILNTVNPARLHFIFQSTQRGQRCKICPKQRQLWMHILAQWSKFEPCRGAVLQRGGIFIWACRRLTGKITYQVFSVSNERVTLVSPVRATVSASLHSWKLYRAVYKKSATKHLLWV